MNIDSMIQSFSSTHIADIGNNETEHNTLPSKVVSVKNSFVSFDLANIKNLPYVTIKNIASYLNIEDTYNIKTISIYGDIIYQDRINCFQKELIK